MIFIRKRKRRNENFNRRMKHEYRIRCDTDFDNLVSFVFIILSLVQVAIHTAGTNLLQEIILATFNAGV